jgi:hypothetical protein
MSDKTDNQILAECSKAVSKITELYPKEEIEIIHSFFEGAPHDAKTLWLLGRSFEALSSANLAYFIDDWREYRGCMLEHKACKDYCIHTIEE